MNYIGVITRYFGLVVVLSLLLKILPVSYFSALPVAFEKYNHIGNISSCYKAVFDAIPNTSLGYGTMI